jgi:hypothetical protein
MATFDLTATRNLVQCSAGDTVNLPDIRLMAEGFEALISGVGSGSVTVSPFNGDQTVGRETSYTLTSPGLLKLASNGYGNWLIIATGASSGGSGAAVMTYLDAPSDADYTIGEDTNDIFLTYDLATPLTANRKIEFPAPSATETRTIVVSTNSPAGSDTFHLRAHDSVNGNITLIGAGSQLLFRVLNFSGLYFWAAPIETVANLEDYVVPGDTGNLLTSNGTTWVSQAPSGGGGITDVQAGPNVFASVDGGVATVSAFAGLAINSGLFADAYVQRFDASCSTDLPAGKPAGTQYLLIRSYAGGSPVTVNAPGGTYINDQLSITLDAQYQIAVVTSDGTDWYAQNVHPT